MYWRMTVSAVVVLLDQLDPPQGDCLALAVGGFGRAEATNPVRAVTLGNAGTFSLLLKKTDHLRSLIS